MLSGGIKLVCSIIRTGGKLEGGPVCQSTPESSQTESEDVSPQVQRRRRLHSHSRDSLPRFSISGEEDWLRYEVTVEV